MASVMEGGVRAVYCWRAGAGGDGAGVRLLAAIVGVVGLAACAYRALDLNRLDAPAIRRTDETIKTLEPMVVARKRAGTLPLITLHELYAPLTADQRALLDEIRVVRPERLRGSSPRRLASPNGASGASRRLRPLKPDTVFDRLEGQTVTKGHESVTLDTQYLPRPVFQVYQRMMAAMQRDLGKRLLVESGYRSPAHQLYLFLYYLPKHGYSIRETNRFVALPGCSEHGSPARQAIDFINEEGINGEDHPEEFEALPEYGWLTQHAHEYGFVLSYPRNNPTHTAFEPWHWHYEDP